MVAQNLFLVITYYICSDEVRKGVAVRNGTYSAAGYTESFIEVQQLVTK